MAGAAAQCAPSRRAARSASARATSTTSASGTDSRGACASRTSPGPYCSVGMPPAPGVEPQVRAVGRGGLDRPDAGDAPARHPPPRRRGACPSGSRPDANCPPGQVTRGWWSRSQGSAAAASATASSRAGAGRRPGPHPAARPSGPRRRGGPAPSSPSRRTAPCRPRCRRAAGCRRTAGARSVLRRASSARSARCTGQNASTAETPSWRVLPCAARPATSRRKVRAPAFAVTTPSARRLGDDRDVAACARAAPWRSAPRPPSSSLTTLCSASRRSVRTPERCRARATARLTATPAFMSQAPRPCSTPFSMRGRERLCIRPVRDIADGHDVDVTLEHEPRHPVARMPCRPRRSPRARAPRCRGSRGRPAASSRSSGPQVDLEPGLLAPPGDGVLQLALGVGAGDARAPGPARRGWRRARPRRGRRAPGARRASGRRQWGRGPAMHGTVCRVARRAGAPAVSLRGGYASSR